MATSTSTIVIVSISLTAILVLCLYSYIKSREEAHYQHLRYHGMTNQLRRLQSYVSKFRDEVKGDFEIADGEMKAQAEKVMTVIGDAIAREALEVDNSFAENKKAVAALHALVLASADSFKELVGKLGAEEKQQVLHFMKAMEARHVEIVSYLSEGGLDKVANLLAASMTPEGFRSHEGFQQDDLDYKLTALLGIKLSPEELSDLHRGIILDTTAYRMTPRESVYVRLSKLAPVVAKARLMRSEELASNKAEIFDRIQKLDNAHREAVMAAAAAVSNNVIQSGSDLSKRIDAASSELMKTMSSGTTVSDKAVGDLNRAIGDVKSALVSASNDITTKSANAISAAETNIAGRIGAVQNAIDTSNFTVTTLLNSNDKAIAEARKWSSDNLENLKSIQDAISQIQAASAPATTSASSP